MPHLERISRKRMHNLHASFRVHTDARDFWRHREISLRWCLFSAECNSMCWSSSIHNWTIYNTRWQWWLLVLPQLRSSFSLDLHISCGGSVSLWSRMAIKLKYVWKYPREAARLYFVNVTICIFRTVINLHEIYRMQILLD